MSAKAELVAFVDGRCGCKRCEESGREGVYRMVGRCRNCAADPVLILYRSGDPAHAKDCPLCGNYWSVEPYRRASEDEIPAAARRT